MPQLLATQVGGNSTSSYGDRRMLLDKVLIIDGRKTPFLSTVKKTGIGTPMSLADEWPLDLEEPIQDLAVVDGDPAGSAENAQTKYVVVAGRLQLNRTVAGVSPLAELQNQAGVKNKRSYARLKKLRQLQYCLEALYMSEQEVQVGTAVVPNKLRGVGGWLTTSIATSGYAVSSDYIPNSSQILSTATASTTADTLNGAMGATWDRGGVDIDQVYMGFCGRLFKQQISTLTGYASGTNAYRNINTYTADLAKRVLWQTIDTFKGDCGTLELVPHQLLAHTAFGGTTAKMSRYCYGLNMSTWEALDGNIEAEKELAYDGSGWAAEFKNLVGLRCLHPKANFAIKATS